MKELWNPSVLIEALKKHNLWAKKGFGQNFLISKNVLDSIVETADIQATDQIIEIGPGPGVLSQELCARAQKVTCIELDSSIIPLLKETLDDFTNYEILNMDVLDYDPNEAIPYKVVANIPYNITSPIIKHFLQRENPPTTMTMLVQNEVADKMSEKKNSILKLQIELFGTVKKIRTVSKNSFHPAPKVDSAIIHIEVYQATHPNHLDLETANKVLKLAKQAFSQKRKKMKSTLKPLCNTSDPKLIEALEKNNLNFDQRPETLHRQDWIKLIDLIPAKNHPPVF